MVQVIIKIPEKETEKLKRYMFEKNIRSKSAAVVEIISGVLK